MIDQDNNEFIKAKNYIYDIYKNRNKIKSIRDRYDKIRIKNSNSQIYKLIHDQEKK